MLEQETICFIVPKDLGGRRLGGRRGEVSSGIFMFIGLLLATQFFLSPARLVGPTNKQRKIQQKNPNNRPRPSQKLLPFSHFLPHGELDVFMLSFVSVANFCDKTTASVN